VTGYLSHNFHPYPAKFIPQIPRALIEHLSKKGETVLDPFCGSGTTLVEAILCERNAIGVDVNPLAALISRAKTAQLGEAEVEVLEAAVREASRLVERRYIRGSKVLAERARYLLPKYHNFDYWFDRHVAEELALIKSVIIGLRPPMNDILLGALSSIIVGVSHQDGETRYARVERRIARGETLRRFVEKMKRVVPDLQALARRSHGKARVFCEDAQALKSVAKGSVDLAVFSPPYPNAFDYHLYHRHRMFWLDMDPIRAKEVEIGAHLKYEPDESNFRDQMFRAFVELRRVLRQGRFMCCVIGDSLVRGRLIDNAKLLSSVGQDAGFRLMEHLKREIRADRKYFSGAMERLREESILVFRRM